MARGGSTGGSAGSSRGRGGGGGSTTARRSRRRDADDDFDDASILPAPTRLVHNRGANGVAGPTSALTSFLREHGIQRPVTDGFNGNVVVPEEAAQHDAGGTGAPPGLSAAYENHQTSVAPVEVGEDVPVYDDEPQAGGARSGSRQTRGRRVADDVDSDEIDEDEPAPVRPVKKARTSAAATVASISASASTSRGASAAPGAGGLKAVGEFMNCAQCTKRFTVTKYTQPHPNRSDGFLCHDCCVALGIDPFAKPSRAGGGGRRKQGAAAGGRSKEDRKLVSYEEKKGPQGLGDLCIKLIGKHIADVDALGDIGSMNMDKICRIISKSRRLTAETASLFWSGDRTDLRMYDCTNLVSDSYVTLASLCPNLERLQLDLCGRIDTDAMIKWGKSFKKLERIELDAPFLVRVDGWKKFAEGHKKLKGFLITQSPRFDEDCLKVLLKNCPELTELRLKEVGKLHDDWLPHIAKFKKLERLDLSDSPDSLLDGPVVKLLEKIGRKLTHLNLSSHSLLTDAVLDGISKHCPNLRELVMDKIADYSLKKEEDDAAHQIRGGMTDDGVAAFFAGWTHNKGLEHVSFAGCPTLQDKSLAAVIAHSGSTLRQLDISGWREATNEAIEAIGTGCPALRELDVGWCRLLSDWGIKAILDGCAHLEEVRVWGCNKLTDNVPRKKGCRVVGIESHVVTV